MTGSSRCNWPPISCPVSSATICARWAFWALAPTYHKDLRLSRDVIETLASPTNGMSAWTRSRAGFLGLTVACARCHDHKFDPISNEDYYALAGVFASSMPVRRPLSEVDAETEKKVAFGQVRGFFLRVSGQVDEGRAGHACAMPEKKQACFEAELAKLKRPRRR